MKRGLVLCALCILLAAVHARAAAANTYYYDQLSEDAKFVYDQIQENRATLFSDGELIIEQELDTEACASAVYAFRLDHPEVFWLGRGWSASTFSSSSNTKYGAGLPSDWRDFLDDNGGVSSVTRTVSTWDPVNGWTTRTWDGDEWSEAFGGAPDSSAAPSDFSIPDWSSPSGQESGTVSIRSRISLPVREEWKTGGRSVENDEAELKKRVAALAAEAREKKTVYDQLLYVHDWLTKSNSSQAAQYQATGFTIPDMPLSALQADLSPSSAGYATAFKLVCDQLQIPCVLVLGSAKYTACTDGHMWNCVQMADGKWYVVDVMKDDPNSTAVVSGWENRKYFLVGSQNLDEHKDNGALPYPALSPTNFDPGSVPTPVQTSAVPSASAPVSVPSDWAKAEVSAAIENGLIPENLRSGYQNNITRLDFARLTVALVEKCTGQEAEDYLTSIGKTLSSRFEDTSDADALAASSLGIVKGRKKTAFDPNGSITRQEAATMLSRAAELLGAQANGKVKNYNDSGQFASWATDAIAYVSSLRTPDTNKAVMGSVGSKQFAPGGTYTREQAYISTYRLFRTLGG